MQRNTQRMAAGLLVLLFVIMAVAPTAMAKKPWEKIDIPELNEIKMPSYERVELSNGMILFLTEDHTFPLVELSATIDVGSIYETPDKLGLASMTGQVMRSGGTVSLSGDELDELVEAKGIAVETFIGQTSGGAFLSVMKEDTKLGMELLADILMNPAFPDDKIKLAKEGQKAGISRRNDDPGTIAGREARKVIFGAEHPMARHPEYDTIASVTSQDMKAFHGDWFHPDRMYLVVIGDFNSQDMVKLIEDSFAGWAKATKPLPADPEIPDLPRTVNVVDKDDINQSTVFMAHKGIRADNPNYAGVMVANRILGGGFSTRLFNEIRSRQGLAYSVGSNAGAGFRYPGMFMARVITKSGSSQHASEAVITEIQKMLDEDVTDDELSNAKDGILNSEVFSFDTKREILDRMVMFERYGYEADFLQKYQESVKNMTKEDMRKAVNEVWKPEQMTILAVGNYKDWDGDFTTFGAVNQVDITIPEPALEIPEPTTDTLERGQMLMAAAREEAGGAKKIAGLKSLYEESKLDATIQGMALTFVTEKTVLYPDHSHTLLKTPFGNQTVVLAGDKGWSDTQMGVTDIEGSDLTSAVAEIQEDMLGTFRNLDKLMCQALDPEEIEGTKCFPVYVTGYTGGYKIFFLNASDNKPFMVQSQGVNPVTQSPAVQKVFIDEYMTADGFNIGKIIRLTYDDELFGTGTVETFKANPKVDMSLFQK